MLTFHHSLKAQLHLTVFAAARDSRGFSSPSLVETLTKFYGKSNVGSQKKLLEANYSHLRGAQKQEVAVQCNHLWNGSPLWPLDQNRCSFADDFALKRKQCAGDKVHVSIEKQLSLTLL